MQTASGRYEFDPADIDAVMDQIAEKADRRQQFFNMATCGIFKMPTDAEVEEARKLLNKLGLR